MSDQRLNPIAWKGEERKPVVATCGDEECGFQFPIAYMPMELLIAADLMQKARCPMCGNKNPTVG